MAIITGLEDQILIAFLFVLAVVFGALNLVNIFKSRAANFIIALALGAFAVSNAAFIATLNSLIPNLTWFFILIFLIAFTMELFGIRKTAESHTEGMIMNAAVLLILFGVGAQIIQTFNVEVPFSGGISSLLFLVGFLLIIALFWSVMKMRLEPTAKPLAKGQ